MSEVRGVSDVNGVQQYKYFVNGEWPPAEANELFDVDQPYGSKRPEYPASQPCPTVQGPIPSPHSYNLVEATIRPHLSQY